MVCGISFLECADDFKGKVTQDESIFDQCSTYVEIR